MRERRGMHLRTSSESMISIIMPVYNSEKFLAKSIESVITQTYANWQLILIDDESTDHSIDICESYVQKDKRIMLMRNQQNLGVAQTRNVGIQAATGEYIAFLDSDDQWKPYKLDKQLKSMLERKAAFSCSSYSVCDEDFNIVGERTFPNGFKNYRDLLKTNSIGCLTVMIQATILKENLMPNVHHEDYATWLNILKSGIDVLFISDSLAIYTKRETSVSSNKFNTVAWIWNIFHREQKFSVAKSSFYLIRFLFFGVYKYSRE